MIPDHPAVEGLGDHHDRSTFSCGKAALDRYLVQQAGQDVRRRLAAVFAMCKPGSAVVIAYFTLSALSIPVTEVSAKIRRRIPYPEVPAVLVGRSCWPSPTRPSAP